MKYNKYEMNSYNLHVINTDRFKVNRLVVLFLRKAKKDEITIRNLLGDVLLTSTKKYNTLRLLNIKTEELYGMPYGGGTINSGKYSVMRFSMEFLNDKYTLEPIFEEAINFMMDIIFNPNVTDGAFDEKTFDICKTNLKNYLESIPDYPDNYSHIRLLDEMDKSSPISYHNAGYLEDLDSITPQSLYKYYLSMLKKDMVDVYLIGDVNEKEVKKIIDSKMLLNSVRKNIGNHLIKHDLFRNKYKTIIESKDVKQSKLLIGFKIKNPTFYELNYVSVAYSYILGGSADSLLFKNVREKNSLCYYINSSINRIKSIMVISSGIKKKDFKKTLELIKKELKNMSLGKFSDKYIENGKEMYLNACDEMYDTPTDLLNTYINNNYLHTGLIEEKKKEILKVTKEDIIKFSKKIIIDTIYLLEGSEQDDN